jgi:hypothetical protein
MAYEAGGMSEKLGNRYEGRWVAKQLLMLLHEEIRSVTVELIGPEEEGVDLLVLKKDNVRQLQQCKARFGNRNSWSVKALATRGILGHLKNHLNRDPLLEFVLVTSIPAQPFVDICDSARISNDSPQDFYKYQIQGVGAHRFRTKLFQGRKPDKSLNVSDQVRMLFYMAPPDMVRAAFS